MFLRKYRYRFNFIFIYKYPNEAMKTCYEKTLKYNKNNNNFYIVIL